MTTGRQTQFQQVHFLRLTLTYAQVGVAQAFKAQLPAGAVITDVYVGVSQAFNAGTSNVLSVGFNNTAGTSVLGIGTVALGAIGAFDLLNTGASAVQALAADTSVYATFVGSGTSATSGVANIVVNYIPNNDG